jgi:hypothetical protein
MRRVGRSLLCAAASALFLIVTAPNASAGTVELGSNLSTFAILGGAGVTIGGPESVITGSVGAFPTVAITGVIPTNFAISDGTVQEGGATAQAAQSELGVAMGALVGMGPGTAEGTLNNITLGPGVYSVSATGLTGTLTLDGGGNADASWVFLFGSSFTTASDSQVVVQNTGSGASLYWVMSAGSATLGQDSTFAGNILANVAVTVGTGVTDPCGRLLTQTASVSLDGADAIGIGCSGVLAGSNGLNGGSDNGSVPETGTLSLLSMGLGAGILLLRKFRSIR